MGVTVEKINIFVQNVMYVLNSLRIIQTWLMLLLSIFLVLPCFKLIFSIFSFNEDFYLQNETDQILGNGKCEFSNIISIYFGLKLALLLYVRSLLHIANKGS